jgi:hypothetical protein
MTYIKVDVTKPAGISPGTGSGKSEVIIVDAADVLVYPPRDAKGVKVMGNFVLKPNARMVKLYTTKSKGSAPVESDGEEDSINMKQKFETQHPGNRLEIKEFIQNWLGKDVYIIHGSCADDFREVMGTPCAPLQLKPSKTDGNDARFWTLMFEAFATSQFLPGHYEGELVFGDPVAVADAEAIAVDTETNSHYKLAATSSATSAAFDTVDANHGDIITLIGQGGTTATTLAQNLSTGDNLVVLKSGTTWTALDGAVIHLQVFKAGAKTILTELSRS